MPMVDNNYYNKTIIDNNNNNDQTLENFNPSFNNATSDDRDLVKIDTNKCSTSCCGLNQWPIPNELLDPSISQDELKKYIPSNFGCTSGEYKGCVCFTQENSNYLNNHGNNSHNAPSITI
jgi:hypothetical protein